MEIQLKGQASIDLAIEAMRSKAEIELFGLKYKVVAVRTAQTSVTDNLNGSADLHCTTTYGDLAKAAEEAARIASHYDDTPF